METTTSIRYCSCSKPLWDKLIELGFKEEGSDSPGYGLRQVRRFVKGNLIVEDSYRTITLYRIEEAKGLKADNPLAKREKFKGGSVDHDLLVHFATKGESLLNLKYR